MAMTIVESAAVTGGVHTHAQRHLAAALDDNGSLLGVEEFPATPAGRQALLDWLAAFGPVRRVGVDTVEGWGYWLARHMGHAGVDVVEVGPTGGRGGHADGPVGTDAVGTARAARSGQGRELPAGCDTTAEAIGVLLAARCSAEHARSATVEEIRALVATAPADVGLRLFWRSEPSLTTETAALRPCPGHPVGYATRVALAELGARAVWLGEQIGRLDELVIPLVAAHAAGLLATFAAGTNGAVVLLAATDAEMGA
jgi:transposase